MHVQAPGIPSENSLALPTRAIGTSASAGLNTATPALHQLETGIQRWRLENVAAHDSVADQLLAHLQGSNSRRLCLSGGKAEQLPTQLASLQELQQLTLTSMADLASFDEISSLSGMQHLTLHGLPKFSDDQWPAIVNMKQLVQLELCEVNVSSVPDWLTPENFPKLKVIIINNTPLDYLPDCLLSFGKHVHIYLCGNPMDQDALDYANSVALEENMPRLKIDDGMNKPLRDLEIRSRIEFTRARDATGFSDSGQPPHADILFSQLVRHVMDQFNLSGSSKSAEEVMALGLKKLLDRVITEFSSHLGPAAQPSTAATSAAQSAYVQKFEPSIAILRNMLARLPAVRPEGGLHRLLQLSQRAPNGAAPVARDPELLAEEINNWAGNHLNRQTLAHSLSAYLDAPTLSPWLHIDDHAALTFPPQIESFTAVRHLSVSNMQRLVPLPREIGRMPNLESLILHNIRNMNDADWEVLRPLGKLSHLELAGVAVSTVPSWVNRETFPHLKSIAIDDCKLRQVPAALISFGRDVHIYLRGGQINRGERDAVLTQVSAHHTTTPQFHFAEGNLNSDQRYLSRWVRLQLINTISTGALPAMDFLSEPSGLHGEIMKRVAADYEELHHPASRLDVLVQVLQKFCTEIGSSNEQYPLLSQMLTRLYRQRANGVI